MNYSVICGIAGPYFRKPPEMHLPRLKQFCVSKLNTDIQASHILINVPVNDKAKFST